MQLDHVDFVVVQVEEHGRFILPIGTRTQECCSYRALNYLAINLLDSSAQWSLLCLDFGRLNDVA